MSNGNSVVIVGNVTREVELRFTPTGQPTATFGLAVNRRWQNRQTQEWEEATSFFDIVCWRELAENAAESLTKGARVIVSGRLEQRSWESNGEKRSKVEVVADELGPSLRWATAEVKKNERKTQDGGSGGYGGQGGGGQGGGGQGGYGGQGGAGGGQGGGQGSYASRPARSGEPAGHGYDEEPF